MIDLSANVHIRQCWMQPNGNVVYDDQEMKNLVVDAGLNLLRDRLASKAATLKYYLAAGSANGNTLREIGLFTANTGGIMIARVLLASPIVKTASVTATFTWTINFSAT